MSGNRTGSPSTQGAPGHEPGLEDLVPDAQEQGVRRAYGEIAEAYEAFFPSLQRYEPVGDRTVRYSSGSFDADIEFDADGLVTLYHGYLERIA